MLLQSQYVFAAPLDRVWALLTDVQALSACIPGCRSVVPQGDGRYSLTLTLDAPLISGDYTGNIALLELDPMRSYRMDVDGQGGPGALRGSSRVTLTREATSTRVDIRADAQVSGFVAAFGPRLLESAAQRGLDKFYNCLQKRVVA